MPTVSKEDHSDADCLMVAVLTHGFDNGYLYARDTIYSTDSLWLPFTADKCLTLAGKPKIFFVQVRNINDRSLSMFKKVMIKFKF